MDFRNWRSLCTRKFEQRYSSITFNAADHPVCNGDRLVGILTDRDLAVRAVADGRDPKSTTVEEIMTRQIACCFEDQDIEEAERVMEKNQIRRLPVLDHDNRIVGISF